MIPTRRTLAIALALSLAALAGAFFAPIRTATFAVDVVFVIALIVDRARTPRPDRLNVARRAPPRSGLSQDLERVVRIAAPADPSHVGLALEVREEFPASFEVLGRTLDDDPTGGPDRCRLPAQGHVDLVRIYRPHERGVHALGDLRLRVTSPWGLLQRQSRLHGATRIEIEPALLALKRTLRLAASERWRDLGVRLHRRRGGLVEFESLRDYVHGDDPRLLDWKSFAKRARPIVREFREERGQELVLAFDCGRRMAATTAEGEARGWTKLDHALDAGLQIAAVALQRGDRVGCLAFDSRVRAWLPPARGSARGKGQFERIRDTLFALEASDKESDLDRAMRELALLHRRRALVLILSDVADPMSVDRQRRALAAASSRHKILFAGLDDPSIRAAAEGRIEVDAAVRAASFALMDERRESMRQLHGTGVRVLDTLPAEAAAPLLTAWLEARRGL
ncbi:MAG: DUF58 domain-containing protein [Planctomycetota bacterium]